jgi:hypothetical protein
VSTLWLIPLGLGAVGALARAVTVRMLTRQVEALRESMRPLRAQRDARRGIPAPGPGDRRPGRRAV